MKISFSRAREKNLSHFSSRISRDRDSCQCLYIVSSRAPVRAKTIRAISTYIFLHIWAALYAGICSNRMDGLKFDQKHIGIKF